MHYYPCFSTYFIVHYYDFPRKSGGTEIEWNTSTSVLMMLICLVKTSTTKKNTETLLEANREDGLKVNTEN
jgi:hypothetical protein